jgi:DNA helicase II / ATP-dependent DNA helicase PcrA
MKEVGFSYLNELNDVQREAVINMNGPIMVIAGPGSGKTRVLTYKIAHMLNSGIHPGNILALTFTNKAAKGMKDRITNVVGQSANRVMAGTFHSIFARILRVEAYRLGFPNDFTIYDSDDTKSVIAEVIKTLNLDKKTYVPGQIKSRISSAKSNLITPKAYAVNDSLIAEDRMAGKPLIYLIYEKYVAKCQKAGAMDFDDLLLQMFKLLYQNNGGVREKYQQQFKYILVDEFQDTNSLQYEILKLLCVYPNSPRNICIVGDDAQSIYAFRGATIENILMFEKDFSDLQVFKLEQNYRSTKYIVGAANNVIENNPDQLKKTIWTNKEDGPKIKVVKTMSETEEGKRIGDIIIEQKNRYNLQNKDIAILYRTNGQSRIFEEALRRYNIAYRIYGGLSFYQRKEIKDLVAYMRMSVNDKDDEALKRIINYPRRGIGDSTLEGISQIANDNDISMWEVLAAVQPNSRTKKSIEGFIQLIFSIKKYALTNDAYKTALFIAKHSGIIDSLKAEGTLEAEGRVENINSLLDGIQEFVEDDVIEEGEVIQRDKSLGTFLQTISLMTDADDDKENLDVVTLMSVHAAKGLEFKSVFVTGLEENLFPSYQSMSMPELIAEERRLFYVAITRAETYLTLSFANSRYNFGQMRFNDQSRFIDEINIENIDAISGITREEKSSGPLSKEPKLLGAFKPKQLSPKIDLSKFVASPPDKIQEGMKVLHPKFGEGDVVAIDERRVATINFPFATDGKEKRIVLQFAKLQILD